MSVPRRPRIKISSSVSLSFAAFFVSRHFKSGHDRHRSFGGAEDIHYYSFLWPGG